MDMLRISYKGMNKDIQEKFHVYEAAKFKPILSTQYITDSNSLFDSSVERKCGETYKYQQCL
jgi:hypothetical protein